VREKSRATQEWILRLLDEDGPQSANELSKKMYLEQWERWAEEHDLGGEIEWDSGSEPVGARLLANVEARKRGVVALASYRLYNHLVRMERDGFIERIQIPGHRPILWRRA